MDLIMINGNHIEDSYSLTQLLHCKNHLKATILPGNIENKLIQLL